MSEQYDVREIGMPRLSDSMEEATVTRWLKRPGDAVAKGEELVEVETDKATVVYEAEVAGILEEILVDEGAHRAARRADRTSAHGRRRRGAGAGSRCRCAAGRGRRGCPGGRRASGQGESRAGDTRRAAAGE